MARVFNEVTGAFEECSACEQKRLQAEAARAADAGQFVPQRVPRTVYAKQHYATGSITKKYA